MIRTLLNSAVRDKDTLVVLYELPENRWTPYVTWIANRRDPENTYWGHYYETLGDAERDFEHRLSIGYY